MVSGALWDHRSDDVWGYASVARAAEKAFAQAGGPRRRSTCWRCTTPSPSARSSRSRRSASRPGAREPSSRRPGHTARDGAQPVNPSGGLLSRGHPLGATGTAQLAEVVWQLRGRPGPPGRAARVGLVETMGGGAAGHGRQRLRGHDPLDAAVTAVGYPGLLGFREVAGLRTAAGGTVRPGLLYRSGTPQFLDDGTAKALLADTGIRTTIDLRLPYEVAREGRGPLDSLSVRHLPHPFRIRGLVSADSAVAPMVGADPLLETYLGYLRDDAAAVLGVLQELARPDVLPALVHCTVGKDRTGVAIALVLASVGVLPDDIVAEYAAGAADVVEAMERLRTMESYAAAVDVYPRDAWAAPPGVMRRFLQAIDERYGGVPELLEANGVGADVVGRLTDVLVERPPVPPPSEEKP